MWIAAQHRHAERSTDWAGPYATSDEHAVRPDHPDSHAVWRSLQRASLLQSVGSRTDFGCSYGCGGVVRVPQSAEQCRNRRKASLEVGPHAVLRTPTCRRGHSARQRSRRRRVPALRACMLMMGVEIETPPSAGRRGRAGGRERHAGDSCPGGSRRTPLTTKARHLTCRAPIMLSL